MSTTACIINDFMQDRRYFLVFSEEEFQRIIAHWSGSDPLLRELQTNPVFFGRTRWCDLEPHHYGFLVMKNLAYMAALSHSEQEDETHLTVRSLHFLLMAMINSIEQRSHSTVEMLTINRIGEVEVSYSYQATVNMALPPPARPKEQDDDSQKLRIVIDNTKDDEA